MIVVMDEIVGNSTFQSDCIKLLQQNEEKTNEINFNEKWYSLEEDHIFRDFCIQLINVASNFYDLSSCIGYEFWSHNNTTPRGWHIDQEENYTLKMILLHLNLTDWLYFLLN